MGAAFSGVYCTTIGWLLSDKTCEDKPDGVLIRGGFGGDAYGVTPGAQPFRAPIMPTSSADKRSRLEPTKKEDASKMKSSQHSTPMPTNAGPLLMSKKTAYRTVMRNAL